MEKVIYNLVFNRKKKLNAAGKALIQVEAYLDKQKKYFTTKIYVNPNQWDEKKQAVKRHPNKDVLNRYLRNFIDKLERLELDIIRKKHTITLEDLKLTTIIETSSFLEFMQKEIRNSDLKESTQRNHYSTVRILSLYKQDILFNELTFEFLHNLEFFLLQQKYHRNTIAKHMKHLKRYINLAINKDLFDLHKYPFRKYKIKHQETKRVHLTPEELQRLEQFDCQGNRAWRRCLDMFLFSCYTGLRFSDITNIRKDNFYYIDQKLWLIYSSVKTTTCVRLPLYLLFDGKSLPIFHRYENTFGEKLFNVSGTSNSNINKQLQNICKFASIHKRVSFHTARHTNATLLLYNGAHITTVQKLLGHKSVKTTEIYGNIMDMTIVNDLQRIANEQSQHTQPSHPKFNSGSHPIQIN